MTRPDRKLRLSHRFTLVISVVILLVVGLLAGLAEFGMSRTLKRQTELRARSLSLSLAAVARPFLLNYDYLTLQQMADATLEEPDLVYVVILDKEGKVAGYSGHRDLQGKQLTGLADLRAFRAESPRVVSLEMEGPAGGKIHIAESIVPVRLGTLPSLRWGTVRVGLSLEPVRREMILARFFLLLAAAFGFFGAVFASHRLANRVASPLRRLVDAATALERGNWDPEFSVHTGDEIEELAGRFARAAHSLDRQKKELLAAKGALTALNATLEEKVQKRTAELAASREKYRLLVEGSPDAFVLLEQDRIAFANQAFHQIFGYPADAAVVENLRWTHIIHPDFHRVARDHIRSAEERQGEFQAEMLGQTRAGRAVELEVRGRGVRYREGTAVELVLADVGEKRRLLRQVVQSERLRAMGEITAMVAHNFNNLLAVILGRAQLMLRHPDGKIRRSDLETIQSSALRAGEMVRQLQEYFGEQVDLRFTEVDTNALLSEAARYLETAWATTQPPGSPRHRVVLDLAPVPPILGAEPLLQDVFRRILINAAEAMPGGGEIRVRTEVSGSSVLVQIADQGVGMTPDVLRRAFDPFFSTKGSRTRGLGLAASFGLIQRHDGRIDLTSAPGKGTQVLITLPVSSRNRRILPLAGKFPARQEVPGEGSAEPGQVARQDPA
jgi:PAS domain S-box-containing protein